MKYDETVQKADLIITNIGKGKYQIAKSRWTRPAIAELSKVDLIIFLEDITKSLRLSLADDIVLEHKQKG